MFRSTVMVVEAPGVKVTPEGIVRSRNFTVPAMPVPMVTFFMWKSRVPAVMVTSPKIARVPPWSVSSHEQTPVPDTVMEAALWAFARLSPVCVKEPEETLMSPAAKARVPTVTDAPFTSKVAVPPS